MLLAGAVPRVTVRWREVGLFNDDIFPVNTQFLGDDHGEGGFDALAAFRILRNERDHPIRRDPDIGSRNEFIGGNFRNVHHGVGSEEPAAGREIEAEDKTTAADR